MKAQMKAANKSGAELAVIVGESEAASNNVSIRRMRRSDTDKTSDEQQIVLERTAMVEKVRSLLS